MLNAPAIVAAGRPGAQASMTWIAAALSALSFIAAGLLLQNSPVDVQVAGMAASRAVLYALVLMPISQGVFVSRIVGVGMVDYLRLVVPSIAVCAVTAFGGARMAELLLDAGLPSIGAAVDRGSDRSRSELNPCCDRES